MIGPMSETTVQAPPEQGEQQPPDTPAGVNWGRLLDAAGIIAGLLLLVIVADIWTDGRLVSRRLLRQRPDPERAPDAE